MGLSHRRRWRLWSFKLLHFMFLCERYSEVGESWGGHQLPLLIDQPRPVRRHKVSWISIFLWPLLLPVLFAAMSVKKSRWDPFHGEWSEFVL